MKVGKCILNFLNTNNSLFFNTLFMKVINFSLSILFIKFTS